MKNDEPINVEVWLPAEEVVEFHQFIKNFASSKDIEVDIFAREKVPFCLVAESHSGACARVSFVVDKEVKAYGEIMTMLQERCDLIREHPLAERGKSNSSPNVSESSNGPTSNQGEKH